jgi:hydrogenase/urease accessory protein HupE
LPGARLVLGIVFLLVLLVTFRASAHALGRSYCTVTTVPGGIDVTIETGVDHLPPSTGVAPNASEQELGAARARIFEAQRSQVSARTPAGPCTPADEKFEVVTREGALAVAATLRFSCPQGAVTLRNAWRTDIDAASEIVCAIDGSAWTFRRGLEERDVGTPPTLTEVIGRFVKSGMIHVFGGIDHVLFVIVLIVAAARSSRDEKLGAGLKRVAWVVTGFTLGHSVTLIGAGLGVLRLEPRITESVIALSIVAVGLENVLKKEIKWRSLTAMIFGLVHGFGFASVLAETELPRRGAVYALLAFNVGIELAQLAIVGVAFPLLLFAARKAWYERALLRPVSIGVSVLASFWFVKRAAEIEFWPWLGS